MTTLTVGTRSFTPEQVIEHARKGANWFRLIAVFSAINTALVLFDAQLVFVLGLGATMVVDALVTGIAADVEGTAGRVLAIAGLGVNVMIIGTFFLIWHFARKGSVGAFITGLVFYCLDSLIMLVFQDWVGLAFHAFFIFGMVGGLPFVRAWSTAHAALAEVAAAGQSTPPPLPPSG